tara:strand:- start:1077 stop:1775 length:699 start_codon:yes stop_codon:yes gene_type:complete
MKEYGFVYIWYDKKHTRYYIGCHWGNINDGYICSSPWMKQAYSRRPNDFRRRILSYIYTDRKDMFLEEAYWQSFIKDEELRKKYYNIRRHGDNHWSNDPDRYLSVSEKISKKKLGKSTNLKGKSSEDIHGVDKAKEIRENLSIKLKGNIPINKGKSLVDIHGVDKAKEIRAKLRSKRLGVSPSNKNNKGKLKAINNGTETRYIEKEKDIPSGWICGNHTSKRAKKYFNLEMK